VAILGCRESARSPQQRRRVVPGIGEELVEELVAGSYAIAGIRAVGETPLTLARTSEEVCTRSPCVGIGSSFCPYSPECVEGEFSEVRRHGVLRSS
jgi:hypothetical protein